MKQWATYSDYLKSPHWRSLRKRLFPNSGQGKCCACGKHGITELHHVSYRNLGRESACDLVPVCNMCHTVIHEELDQQFSGYPTAQKVLRTASVWFGLFKSSMESCLERYGWYHLWARQTGAQLIQPKSRRTCERCGVRKRNKKFRGDDSICRQCRHKLNRLIKRNESKPPQPKKRKRRGKPLTKEQKKQRPIIKVRAAQDFWIREAKRRQDRARQEAERQADPVEYEIRQLPTLEERVRARIAARCQATC